MNVYSINKFIRESAKIPWDMANELDNFSYPWSKETLKQISFRALWDEQHLYFKFEVTGSNILTFVDKNDKMEIMNSDRVELFFTCDNDLETYYCLEMDSLNRILAYKASFHRSFDYNWKWPKGGLQVISSITYSGYNVEGSITLKSLKKLKLLQGKSIHAGIYRGESIELDGNNASFRWISWIDPKIPEPDFHVRGSFGVLRFED